MWRTTHPLTEEQKEKARIQARQWYTASSEEQRVVMRERHKVRYHARTTVPTEEQKERRRISATKSYHSRKATLTEEQKSIKKKRRRITGARWRQKNPDRIKENKRRYRSSEKGMAIEHSEHSRETRKRGLQNWRKANPLKVAIRQARRRACKVRAIGSHTHEQLLACVLIVVPHRMKQSIM